MLLKVPTIDISPYREGYTEGKMKVARLVNEACRDIGFLVISGHGVPKELIESTYSVAKTFFALDQKEKECVARPADNIMRGYSGVGVEGLSYSLDAVAPPDLKESFDIGPINAQVNDPYYLSEQGRIFFAPNIWPGRPEELQKVWSQYFREMERLSTDLMRIFALALNLPETYFDASCERHVSVFRALHYPSQHQTPAQGQLRAGAHTDYGSLTILRQEQRPGGLQVRNAVGDWVDVAAQPNTFVINIGDLMMRWTNDYWISTMHRVVNPPSDVASNSDRISLVYFHQPNYDAVIECLETCKSIEDEPKYAPTTSGENMLSKFLKQTTLGDTLK